MKKPTNTTSNLPIERGGFVLFAKFVPVTNTRPARIKVTRPDTKQSVMVSWNYEPNDYSENYDHAVQAWVKKFNEDGWLNEFKFVRGWVPTGHTFTAVRNR